MGGFMRLRNVKGASDIIEASNYVIKDYQQYKGQLRDTFLDDLSQLEALGVIPRERQDDVAAVREFLSR